MLNKISPMKRTGPFLLDGAKQVRWTSGCHLLTKYSRTCDELPPKGKCKSGCSSQVVALRRFSYEGHESELCVLYPQVLQTKYL